MKYIDVIVDNKSEYTDSAFTYKAPDEISIGDKVKVPFARRKKAVDGYVVAVNTSTAFEVSKIKEVEEIELRKSLNEEIIDTALWMRKRYGIKYIDAIKMFTVAGKREKVKPDIECKVDEGTKIELNDEQKKVASEITVAIDSGKQKSFLLKGVTNSGKTEVYMEAVSEALSKGKSAIVLVPEIALASQIEKRFKKRFGDDEVSVLHSKLSVTEKLHEWLRLKKGESKICIGARTAIFAPLENIGVIIIDEEHESTYKSDHNPKYETIDIAYRRTSYYKSVLLLGSATPSVVSYNLAENGVYTLLELKQRVGKSVMPEFEVVDMRDEARRGNMGVLSSKLYNAIKTCLENKEQAILFLNRRGFAPQIVCPECGYRMICDECEIALTYHKSDNTAECHYCGRKQRVPKICPECGGKHITFVGSGTEKVEETVCQLFPEAKVKRFDLDTVKSQKEIDSILDDFETRKTDILIGTQILAKGIDFKNVSLVGLVMVDVTLNIPDYRSSERTYQLITQVSGRAGRNDAKSKVIVQTYEPQNEAIKAATLYDYDMMYQGELLHRKIMNYPPYSDIINISFIGKKEHIGDNFGGESVCMKYAEDFSKRLNSMKNIPAEAVVFTPREESVKLASNKERAVFMIKAPKGSRNGYVKAYMDYRRYLIDNNAPCHIEIDINPYGIV